MIIKPYMWSNVKQLFKDIFICVACCCDMGIVVLEYLNEKQVFNASVTADLQFAGWTTWKLTAVAAALVMQGGCSCKAGRVKGGQIDRQSEDRERGRERDKQVERQAQPGVVCLHLSTTVYSFDSVWSSPFRRWCFLLNLVRLFSQIFWDVFNLLYPKYQ